MGITKDDVAKQFGRQSKEYATSVGHAFGPDLPILLEMLKPNAKMRVLDVATGAGHTAAAVAPLVAQVVATDLTAEMVAETLALFAKREIANGQAQVEDVEALSFADASFDAVTCRIAPHHFIDINKAVSEIARVLKPGGVFALEDSIAARARKLDEFINNVERLRDPTHVRAYTLAEWRRMLSANGLRIQRTRVYRKTHDIADWIMRAGIDEQAQESVYAAFAAAPKPVRDHYKLKFTDGRATHFTDDKIILRATKRR